MKQRGFTVVELMISTAAFSAVLLLISAGVIQIGRIFYKGVTVSKTQEISRTVLDKVARDLQFSAGRAETVTIAGNKKALCIGNNHYIYEITTPISSPNDTIQFATSPLGCGGVTSGTNLLADKMRLVSFSVESSCTQLCNINVKVAYGDPEVFLNNNPADGCRGGRAGGHFCAISELTTSVIRRIN